MNVEVLYHFGWLVDVHEQASNLEVSEVNQHGLENNGLLPKWLRIQDYYSTHVFLLAESSYDNLPSPDEPRKGVRYGLQATEARPR